MTAQTNYYMSLSVITFVKAINRKTILQSINNGFHKEQQKNIFNAVAEKCPISNIL